LKTGTHVELFDLRKTKYNLLDRYMNLDLNSGYTERLFPVATVVWSNRYMELRLHETILAMPNCYIGQIVYLLLSLNEARL